MVTISQAEVLFAGLCAETGVKADLKVVAAPPVLLCPDPALYVVALFDSVCVTREFLGAVQPDHLRGIFLHELGHVKDHMSKVLLGIQSVTAVGQAAAMVIGWKVALAVTVGSVAATTVTRHILEYRADGFAAKHGAAESVAGGIKTIPEKWYGFITHPSHANRLSRLAKFAGAQ